MLHSSSRRHLVTGQLDLRLVCLHVHKQQSGALSMRASADIRLLSSMLWQFKQHASHVMAQSLAESCELKCCLAKSAFGAAPRVAACTCCVDPTFRGCGSLNLRPWPGLGPASGLPTCSKLKLLLKSKGLCLSQVSLLCLLLGPIEQQKQMESYLPGCLAQPGRLHVQAVSSASSA